MSIDRLAEHEHTFRLGSVAGIAAFLTGAFSGSLILPVESYMDTIVEGSALTGGMGLYLGTVAGYVLDHVRPIDINPRDSI